MKLYYGLLFSEALTEEREGKREKLGSTKSSKFH